MVLRAAVLEGAAAVVVSVITDSWCSMVVVVAKEG